MLFIITFLFFTASSSLLAKSDLCEVLDLKNCSGVSKQSRRSSAHSHPSPATAASNNPSSVSFDKGLGIELIAQSHNPVVFSIATGTGKMGGALLSPSLENNFFGNRVPEIDETYFDRRIEEHQYKNNKLSIALGGKLIDQKSYGLDAGLLLKRHSLIKRVNPGAGVSGRIGPINFGSSYYQDDFHLKLEDYIEPSSGIPYSILLNSATYQERFSVHTHTAGFKIRNFAMDAGLIKTHYTFTEDDSEIFIYSAAYHYKNFLFNYAARNETSSRPEFMDKSLIKKKMKVDKFWSIQYSPSRHFIFGINYNYFLLDEASLSVTLFL